MGRVAVAPEVRAPAAGQEPRAALAGLLARLATLEAAAQEAAPEDLRAHQEPAAAELGALVAGPGVAVEWVWAPDSEVDQRVAAADPVVLAAAPGVAVGQGFLAVGSGLIRAAVEPVDLAARLLLERPALVLWGDPATGVVALASRQMAVGPERPVASQEVDRAAAVLARTAEARV